jgi:signal peptidase I
MSAEPPTTGDQPEPASDGTPRPLSEAPRRRSFLREIVETALIVVIVYFAIHAFIQPYQVDGSSMTPNLHNSERLFVSRASYLHIDLNALWNLLPGQDRASGNELYLFGRPDRGDIVVLNPPYPSQNPYIKRVIGLPGETVTFHEGSVYIDGKPLDEPYIAAMVATECTRGQWCSVTVPPDSVYVLGDNRDDSTDSRSFGPVKDEAIIGKAVFANWPLKIVGPIRGPDYGPEWRDHQPGECDGCAVNQ